MTIQNDNRNRMIQTKGIKQFKGFDCQNHNFHNYLFILLITLNAWKIQTKKNYTKMDVTQQKRTKEKICHEQIEIRFVKKYMNNIFP
jgi:hypothetical protein